MQRTFAITALAISALGLGSAAQADPIQWTLNGVTFNDGGAATGSFVYDADTNSYSAIDIYTTEGTIGAASHFQWACTADTCPMPSNDEGLFVVSAPWSNAMTGVQVLYLAPEEALGNAGGSIVVAGSTSGQCVDAACLDEPADRRNTVSGSLLGAPYIAPPVATKPVPVPAYTPAGLTLLAASLAALAWWRQRRPAAALRRP